MGRVGRSSVRSMVVLGAVLAGSVVSAPVSGAVPSSSTITIDDPTITEGASLVYTVTRSGDTSTTCKVFLQTADGTATAPGDYGAGNVELVLAPGQVSVGVLVTTVQDNFIEGPETVLLNVSHREGDCTVVKDTGTGTIEDDDGQVGVTVHDLSIPEGTGSDTPLALRVTSSAALAAECGFRLQISFPGTASAADLTADDLFAQHLSGTGDVDATFDLPPSVVGDSLVEGNETFTVTLTSPPQGQTPGCKIVDGTATVTIVDDDSAGAVVNIAGRSVVEGSTGGVAPIAFTITRGAGTPVTCSVKVSLTHVTTNDADFRHTAANRVVFLSTGTSKTVSWSRLRDTLVEGDETFTVTMVGTGATPCPIGNGTATGTIVNDDAGLTAPAACTRGEKIGFNWAGATLAASEWTPAAVNNSVLVKPGTWKVVLTSNDPSHPGAATQNDERWMLGLFAGDSVVATSASIADLPDASTSLTQAVGTVTIPSGVRVDRVSAIHHLAATPMDQWPSSESVMPTRAVLTCQ